MSKNALTGEYVHAPNGHFAPSPVKEISIRRRDIVKMLMERPHTADELAEHFGVKRRTVMENLNSMLKSRRIFGVGAGGHPTTYEYNPNYPGV